MLTTKQILDVLNNESSTDDTLFLNLGDAYSFLIDCRLNILRGDNNRWAIVFERLGYTQKGGYIELVLTYYGNCVDHVETVNGKTINNYTILPVDEESFSNSTDGFYLKHNAQTWLVRDATVKLETQKEKYLQNGISLKEYEPGKVNIEEAARLAIISYRDVFRATDEELNKYIPSDLEKILVLDEWYHKDFNYSPPTTFSDERLKYIYDFNKQISSVGGLDFESFTSLIKKQEATNVKIQNNELNNRPGTYETWNQLAKAIATGDTVHYKPTLLPNTHWSNWHQSGSL